MPAPQIESDDAGKPGPKPLRWLRERNPCVDHEYLEDIRALYAGGRFLLRNPEVFPRLFPRFPRETDDSYNERRAKAFYVNNFATVIDFMVSGLAQDPARIKPADEQAPDAAVADEFLAAFEADTSAPGGDKLPWSLLGANQARNALLYQRIWTLVDLPDMGDDYAPTSRLDQERDGSLAPWALPLDPLDVLDWEVESNGELCWVRTRCVERIRSSPDAPRDTTRTEYRVFTRTHWALYVVDHRDGTPAAADTEIVMPAAVRPHGFGKVPVSAGCLPVGMWAANKLFSLAVEYLNKSCGLAWAELRSLYQQLYEFLDDSYPGVDAPPKDGAAADPHRAVRQPRGIGRIQVRGASDKAEFIGPDPGPFTHALASLEALRDDMHRVTYQMALSADTSGAAIRRSAESKGKDGEAGVIVLVALGAFLRPHLDQVLDLICTIRGIAAKHITAGMEQFQVDDLEAAINRAVMLETVTLPSATAKKLLALRLIRKVLGADATADAMATIEKELDGAITQDQLEQPPPPIVDPGAAPPDAPPEPTKPPAKR